MKRPTLLAPVPGIAQGTVAPDLPPGHVTLSPIEAAAVGGGAQLVAVAVPSGPPIRTVAGVVLFVCLASAVVGAHLGPAGRAVTVLHRPARPAGLGRQGVRTPVDPKAAQAPREVGVHHLVRVHCVVPVVGQKASYTPHNLYLVIRLLTLVTNYMINIYSLHLLLTQCITNFLFRAYSPLFYELAL